MEYRLRFLSFSVLKKAINFALLEYCVPTKRKEMFFLIELPVHDLFKQFLVVVSALNRVSFFRERALKMVSVLGP